MLYEYRRSCIGFHIASEALELMKVMHGVHYKPENRPLVITNLALWL